MKIKTIYKMHKFQNIRNITNGVQSKILQLKMLRKKYRALTRKGWEERLKINDLKFYQ